MRWLATLHGKTDGSTTEGTIKLKGDMLYEEATYIRIPKGLKLKIWCKRISGAPAEIIFNVTHDVTVSTPSWEAITSEVLASPGELTLEKRRPIVVTGITGKEAVSITWDQTTYPGSAGVTYVDIEVELTDE